MRIATKINIYYLGLVVLFITGVASALYAEIDYASTPGIDYQMTVFTFLRRFFSQPFVWAAFVCGWRIIANSKIVKDSKDNERYK
jgi:hypothetical protein